MTSIKIILDASAWIEYFEGTHLADIIENYLFSTHCLTLSITVAETVVKIKKAGKNPEEAITALRNLSTIIHADERMALEAADIYIEQRKIRPKLALSDAFIIALARKENAHILTKDTDFTGLPETILLQ